METADTVAPVDSVTADSCRWFVDIDNLTGARRLHIGHLVARVSPIIALRWTEYVY